MNALHELLQTLARDEALTWEERSHDLLRTLLRDDPSPIPDALLIPLLLTRVGPVLYPRATHLPELRAALDHPSYWLAALQVLPDEPDLERLVLRHQPEVVMRALPEKARRRAGQLLLKQKRLTEPTIAALGHCPEVAEQSRPRLRQCTDLLASAAHALARLGPQPEDAPVFAQLARTDPYHTQKALHWHSQTGVQDQDLYLDLLEDPRHESAVRPYLTDFSWTTAARLRAVTPAAAKLRQDDILRALRSDDAQIRAEAIRLCYDQPALLEAAAADSDDVVRARAARQLGWPEKLATFLAHPQRALRHLAAQGLAELGELAAPARAQLELTYAGTNDPVLKAATSQALHALGSTSIRDWPLRYRCENLLIRADSDRLEVLDALQNVLKSSAPDPGEWAALQAALDPAWPDQTRYHGDRPETLLEYNGKTVLTRNAGPHGFAEAVGKLLLLAGV